MTLVPAFALVLLWYTPYCDRTATAGTRTVKDDVVVRQSVRWSSCPASTEVSVKTGRLVAVTVNEI